MSKEIILQACREFLKKIPDNLNYITADKLNELIQKKTPIFLLDTRTSEAFSKGHIPGAKNIFLKQLLDDEFLKLLPRDALIVVCCWVGHTASQALTVLQLNGYNAIGLKYGMGTPANQNEPKKGWCDFGYDTE